MPASVLNAPTTGSPGPEAPLDASERAAQGAALAPADAKTRALARLAASRQRLALQLLPPPAPALCGEGAQAGPLSQRIEALWRHWRARAHSSPLASMALAAAQQWWRLQPWRGTAELLVREWRRAAVPVVRRHPVAAVGLAAALAASLVVWRPWRSPRVANHTQALGQRARGWLMSQARQLPWQTLMAGLVAVWAGQHAHTQADANKAADNDPGPAPQPISRAKTTADTRPAYKEAA